ncbi:MAG: LOG family protein ORF6 in fasciation locus [Bacteroidetes bacterium ADurb.Bin141]|nr:MAG: LOG family protein ORF6 in fasciation locus [Bacteroidetes bacterium OLB10]MBE7509273.1 TIGR00730 family Rossman fold protein [Bacteroidia bacterium]MBX3106402.1 TIGR00730 family Rossman fold protein [Bacteroidota bacterium]MCE7954236.1 TIGR00730 family Rossman fold protein [Bacteroidetes bacterium CHB6]OQB64395.1 MAG: LOG family protein ORF6 in fasciation locus [Bacteroidetes bacterium ADurb.Bin141]
MHNHSEEKFLQEKQSRLQEFLFTLKVMREFIKGFRTLHFVGPCVTVFGSARFGEEHPYYKLGMEAGSALSKLGFAVMTGGGPGIMEAANRGAKEAGGLSLGCNIVLPKEQTANPYLDKVVEFNHFFVRKVLMFKYSFAFVVLPGGVGTTDEMFEALTLIQTKKVSDFPVILMGKEFWKPLLDLLDTFDREKTASRTEFDSLLVTDSIAEMTEFVRVKAIKRFKLAKELQMKRSKWFFEKE